MSISQSWLPPFSQQPSSLSSSLSRSTLPAQPTTSTLTSTTFLDASYLSSLHTRALNLQHHLQSLLDIQSAHLTSHPINNDFITTTTNSTSSLPTTRDTTSNGRVIPVRQPHRPPPSLFQTRRAFSTTMIELSTVRAEESTLHSSTLASLSATASSIDSWQSRRRTLDAEVTHIEQTAEVSRLKQLKQVETVLDSEIEALQVQLVEKRSQQRSLRVEVKTLENSVASTLSSYRASKELLDNEIKTFLATQAYTLRPNQDWRGKKQEAAKWMTRSWYQQVRTERNEEGLEDALAAALEEIDSRAGEARREQDAAKAEQVALDEGVEIWDTVMSRLRQFEKTLGEWMKMQQQQQQRHAQDNRRNKNATMTAQEIMISWEETLQELLGHLSHVEDKGWNLLTCCIGAEVAALKLGYDAFVKMVNGETNKAGQDAGVIEIEGPEILFASSIQTKQDTENGQDGYENAEVQHAADVRRGSARLSGNGRRDRDRQISPVRTYVARRPVRLESEDEDEDDDDDAPDADMLISEQR